MPKPKIDLINLKKQRQAKEVVDEITETPEALIQSYERVWGKEKENVLQIELTKLYPFKDKKNRVQPFKIFPDKVEQIKLSATDIGIVTPLIVRKYEDGYQIISGHHRYIAAKELNLLSVPCVVRDISDDEAIKFVAECNIQRSKLLPTEYAEIYARYMELRNDIDMTSQEIADKFGISRKSLYRYIKILDLTDDLRSLIDDNMLHTDTAEIFAEFSEENQESVFEYVQKTKKKVNRAIAKQMEEIVRSRNGGHVTSEEFKQALDKHKTLYSNKLYGAFSKKYGVNYSDTEWDDLISKLVDEYFANRNRKIE